MISNTIKALKEGNGRFSEAFKKIIIGIPALQKTDGSPLKVALDQDVPEAYGSIKECQARAEVLLGYVDSIAALPSTSFQVVAKTSLTGLQKAIDEITNQLVLMDAAIEKVSEDGGLRDVDSDLIIHSVAQQNHPNVDLRPYYKAIDNHVDQGLNAADQIFSVVKPKSFDPFSGALSTIEILKERLDNTHREVSDLLKDAKSKTTQISTKASGAEARSDELEKQSINTLKAVEAIKNSVEQDAAAAESAKGQITKFLTDITENIEEAAALKVQVDELQEPLNKFQSKLEERNTTFEEGKVKLNDLEGKMITGVEKSEEYISKSKAALGWTTAEGLASSFATSSRELNCPLLLSRFGFYFAIALLFISTAVAFNGIPQLQQYIVMPKLPAMSGRVDAALLVGLLSVLFIKLTVLLPAVLFVGFTSRRHRALFHQHQLYVYKKTIAAALPGFKDHASAHQEALAAAAFSRLLFNPQEDSSRDLIKEAGGQWWLSRWLERVISKGVKGALANSEKGGD